MMTKLIPIFINGERWVQLAQLPPKQAERLKSWLPKGGLRNLFYNGLELKDCVEFASYAYWFRNHQISSSSSSLHAI